jgi:hypothetical protein
MVEAMTRSFLRARRAAIGAGVSAAFALAAPGCAWVDQPQGYRTRAGGYTQTSSIKDSAPSPVAAANPKPKVAAASDANVGVAVPKAPPPSKPAQLAQETACVNVEQCASVLKAMIDDPRRGWMNWPASATTLANGVRLFAYRTLRPKLTCRELTTALHEVTIATAAFAGPVPGLQPNQIQRARTLSAQVAEELKAERATRCEKATGQALDLRQGALPAIAPEGRPAAAGREVR